MNSTECSDAFRLESFNYRCELSIDQVIMKACTIDEEELLRTGTLVADKFSFRPSITGRRRFSHGRSIFQRDKWHSIARKSGDTHIHRGYFATNFHDTLAFYRARNGCRWPSAFPESLNILGRWSSWSTRGSTIRGFSLVLRRKKPRVWP